MFIIFLSNRTVKQAKEQAYLLHTIRRNTVDVKGNRWDEKYGKNPKVHESSPVINHVVSCDPRDLCKHQSLYTYILLLYELMARTLICC